MSDLDVIVKSLPKLIEEVYGDLAKPGAIQAGKAIETIVGLGNTVLWPVALLNERSKIVLESNLNRYRQKMEQIPVEDVVPIPSEVGVPVLEKFTHVTNEELCELYAELLRKASINSTQNLAHPSFANILSNLSPDEALILKAIKGTRGVPVVEVRYQKASENEWVTMHPMLAGINCLADLSFPDNVPAYFSNLEGQGLITKRVGVFMVGENIYEPLESTGHRLFSHLEDQFEGYNLKFIREKLEITQFGELMLKACVA